MIDTIKLVIYDIGDGLDGVPGRTGMHRPLVEHLKYLNTTRLQQSRFSVNSNSDVRVNKTFLNRDMLFFSATNKLIERSALYTKQMPSSNYKIRYNIDYADDNFSVEFSLPKYFFGTNVLQTVFNPTDKDFDPYNQQKNTLEYQYSLIYERFIAYVKAFFKIEFPGLSVDFSKVELKRIDICYNLVFPDRLQALNYLDAQKNLRRKRQREGTTASTNYETSIFIKNADYSFKIYHKGAEYEKHDRKEHQKVNEKVLKKNSLKPLGKLAPYGMDIPKPDFDQVFPIDDIQELADRTLRFEMTFRSSYISKIFNQIIRTDRHFHSVQHNCVVESSRRFNNFRKYFNRITTILQNRVNWDKYRYNQKQLPLNKVAHFSFTLTHKDPLQCCNYVAFMAILDKLKEPLVKKTGGKLMYNSYYDLLYAFAGLKEKDYKNDLKMLDVFYSRMSAYYSKHHKIMLKLNDDDLCEFLDHYNSADISHIHVIKFTKSTMAEMTRRFLDSVYQFEVKSLPDFYDFKQQLLDTKVRNINKSQILIAYKFWSDGVTLEQQAKLFDWADSTLRRYKTRFKMFGIERSYQGSKVPTIEFSFSRYFENLVENKFHFNFSHSMR